MKSIFSRRFKLISAATLALLLLGPGTRADDVVTDGVVTGAVQLASLDAEALPEGSKAWVRSVRAPWLLKQEALPIDHISVEAAANKPGYEWERLSIPSKFFPASPTWYLDPANSTGFANDENAGTSAVAPLATAAEFSRRFYGAQLTQDVTLNLLSNLPSSDPLTITGVRATTTRTINVVGQTTLIASGTMSAAHAPASVSANDHYSITDGSATFGPWVEKYVIHKTNGTQAWTWPYKDLGSGELQTSLPLNVFGTGVVALAALDSYNVESLPDFSEVIINGSTQNLVVKLSLVRVVGGPVGSQRSVGTTSAIQFDRCIFANPVVIVASTVITTTQLLNVMIPAPPTVAVFEGSFTFWGGLFVGNGTTSFMQLTSCTTLGGNASNVPTLGGMSIRFEHDAFADRQNFMIYDWTSRANAALIADHQSQVEIDNFGGERNTGALVGVDTYSAVYSFTTFPGWNSSITTYATPYIVGGGLFAAASLGKATNQIATQGAGIAQIGGSWSRDLSGNAADPNVVGITEAGGTDMSVGHVADKQCMARSASSVVGVSCSGANGSLAFYGPDGQLAQDNDNLFYDQATEQIKLSDGSTGSPSYSFRDHPDSGMSYDDTYNMLALAANGLDWIEIGGNNLYWLGNTIFWTSGLDASITRDRVTGMFRIKSSYGISFADGTFPADATAGLLELPSCDGPPTGVPSLVDPGAIPYCYDAPDDRVYQYNTEGVAPGWKVVGQYDGGRGAGYVVTDAGGVHSVIDARDAAGAFPPASYVFYVDATLTAATSTYIPPTWVGTGTWGPFPVQHPYRKASVSLYVEANAGTGASFTVRLNDNGAPIVSKTINVGQVGYITSGQATASISSGDAVGVVIDGTSGIGAGQAIALRGAITVDLAP